MNTRYLALSLAATLITAVSTTMSATVSAAETLELEIVTPSGHSYRMEQELGKQFETFDSGPIAGEQPPRDYLAIRCDGPWGAMKYHLALVSGPGFLLRASGDQLLLEIQEHSVISEDQTISAMRVHCIDTEPRQVVTSVAEVKLDRGKATNQQMELANGYQLNYRYTP